MEVIAAGSGLDFWIKFPSDKALHYQFTCLLSSQRFTPYWCLLWRCFMLIGKLTEAAL
jgi:hypothetical protein